MLDVNKEQEKMRMTDPSNTEKWFSRGVTHCINGEYEKAIQYYLQVLEDNPTSLKTLINIALTYGKIDDKYSRIIAIEFLHTAAELDSRLESIWNNMGVFHIENDNIEEGLLCLQMARKINPSSSIVLGNMGVAYHKLRKFTNAIEFFNEALSIDKNDAVVLFNKGISYGELDNPNKAIKCYQEALEIDPNNSHIWNNIAIVYGVLCNSEKEIECYTKALEIDPHYKLAKLNLLIARIRDH